MRAPTFVPCRKDRIVGLKPTSIINPNVVVRGRATAIQDVDIRVFEADPAHRDVLDVVDRAIRGRNGITTARLLRVEVGYQWHSKRAKLGVVLVVRVKVRLKTNRVASTARTTTDMLPNETARAVVHDLLKKLGLPAASPTAVSSAA